MRWKVTGAIKMMGAVMGGMLATAASATTLEEVGLARLVTQAPVAVLGQVAPVVATNAADGSYRLVTIKVQDAAWGTGAGELQVVIPGGSQQVGKLRVAKIMPGAPQLLPGTRLLLLLEPSPVSGGWQVVGFNQGVFAVSPGGEVVLPGEANALPVAAAMQRIRELRAEAASPSPQPTLQR